MKGLDLSKFKKTAQDGHSTTLTHADGHELRVAHWGLNSKLKKQISELPLAAGKSKFKTTKMADGGMVAPPDPDKAKAMSSTLKPTATDQAMINAVQHPIKTVSSVLGFADGGEAKADAESAAIDSFIDPASYGPQAPVPDTSAPASVPQSPMPPPATAPVAASATPGATGDWAAPTTPATPGATGSWGAEPNGSWQGSVGHMGAETQANQPVAPMQQPSPQHQSATPADHKQAAMNEMQQHVQDFQHDLDNGHITPETYADLFARKDTLGKIGTIFGMILGGAGAGLAHQPNALISMMDKEIERDLEAQKVSAANKQNYIKLNMEQQMNQANIKHLGQEGLVNEAQAKNLKAEAAAKSYALSKAQMNSAALHQLTQQAQKLPPGSPQRMQADQTLGMLYQAVQGDNYNLMDKAASASAYFKTLMGGGAGDNNAAPEQQFQQRTNAMRMMGPAGEARAKDIEAKHFPGIQGQASVPLSDGDREALNSGISFDQKLHRFIDWSKTRSGDLSPSDRNTGQAMAAELQGAYRQATHGGVYKEGEQNFISKIIDSNPTKFFNQIRVMPQLQAVAHENQQRVDQLAKSKGFQGYQGQQQAQEPQYKTVNGVKYMRGPNGEAIKVK